MPNAAAAHRYGEGCAVYQACRDTGSLKDEVIGTLIRETGILSAVDTDAPLPHCVTAHSRTNGEERFVFVENYSGEETVTVPLRGEMEDLLTGERVTSCTLPPYGYGIFRSNIV